MKFDELKLDRDLVRVAEELNFHEAMYIQEKVIPVIREGKDIFAQSETGSGKTLAFAFPIIEKIVHGAGIQCLVLVPTRELAQQVFSEFRKFAKYRKLRFVSVYGGVAINPQIEHLERAEVVIATPGRMLDHMQRSTIKLDKVKFLVLDEADKMFEMGFIDDVKRIIEATPRNRQTLLFSATINEDVRNIARHYMKHPENIKSNLYVDKKFLEQHYYEVPTREKFSLLVHLINNERPGLGIVFCSTRRNVDVVAKNLQKNMIKAIPIHGGHSQSKRTNVIESFHSGRVHILVATDVAARGLDIKNITHIFNYDIPKTSQEYIHRIGRTARAGKSGRAISLLTEADFDNFRKVLEDRSLNIERQDLPQFQKVPFLAREERGRFSPRSYGGGFGNPELRQRPGSRPFGRSSPHGGDRNDRNERRYERHSTRPGERRPSSGGFGSQRYRK